MTNQTALGAAFRRLAQRKSSLAGVALASFVSVEMACGPSGGPSDTASGEQVNNSIGATHFRSKKIVIQKPGDSVDTPAFAGSLLSPQTLSSSAPEVVEVTPAGRLLGRKKGGALISGLGGETLEVTVLDIRGLNLAPGTLSIPIGGRGKLVALGADGTTIDSDALKWLSTSPALAYVREGVVIAGNHPGKALLTASFGQFEATAVVFVQQPAVKGLTFTKAPSRLRVGSSGQYELTEGSIVSWSSSNPRILALQTPGHFWARETGMATVCALGARNEHACIDVEVIK